MLTFHIENWNDVKKALFLTKKEGTVYAYGVDDRIVIGTAEEIYSELAQHSDHSDSFPMGKYSVPSDNSFLTRLEIKCIN